MLYAGKQMVQNICVWRKRFPGLGVAQQANQATLRFRLPLQRSESSEGLMTLVLTCQQIN